MDWKVPLTILCLAFVQNVSFSIVSRSRNRDNMTYHMFAACFSNGIWFLTMRQLVRSELNGWLLIPYVMGTVTGSLAGVRVSMFIERLIGATADGHVKKKPRKKHPVIEDEGREPLSRTLQDGRGKFHIVEDKDKKA